MKVWHALIMIPAALLVEIVAIRTTMQRHKNKDERRKHDQR